MQYCGMDMPCIVGCDGKVGEGGRGKGWPLVDWQGRGAQVCRQAGTERHHCLPVIQDQTQTVQQTAHNQSRSSGGDERLACK